MPVGTAVFVRVDAGKDMHALSMEIVITRGSETHADSHPLVGKPPPQSLLGVQPNCWRQTRGPSPAITTPEFLF